MALKKTLSVIESPLPANFAFQGQQDDDGHDVNQRAVTYENMLWYAIISSINLPPDPQPPRPSFNTIKGPDDACQDIMRAIEEERGELGVEGGRLASPGPSCREKVEDMLVRLHYLLEIGVFIYALSNPRMASQPPKGDTPPIALLCFKIICSASMKFRTVQDAFCVRHSIHESLHERGQDQTSMHTFGCGPNNSVTG